MSTTTDDATLEAVVEAFESAWRSGRAPGIRDFLPPLSLVSKSSTTLLHELVCVDLEYRWSECGIARKNGTPTAHCLKLEDYLKLLPELGTLADLPLNLITEEYRVRHRWGDRPEISEFNRRFPGRARLGQALQNVSDDLEKERDPQPPSKPQGDSSAATREDLAGIPQFSSTDFILQSHLGSGGIGKVYRAWWKSRKQQVAVKMLRKTWWRQPGADELFFREAAILMRLRHRNIVRMHGIGRTPQGGCFLVIDLLEGGDLSRRLPEPVAIPQAIDWVAQAADALAFAHQQGVVHRDVKPSNLLLDRSGTVHVADFGLAQAPVLQLATAADIVGTIAYMAPEQLMNGSLPVGPAADIFSLGVVLQTLLTGRLPCEGLTFAQIVEQRIKGYGPLNLGAVQPEISAAIEAIVDRCLALDPTARFASANELAMALRHAVPCLRPS